MSAINQMFVGLFGVVSSVVSGITSLVNKWYPVYTRDASSNIRWVNGKAWLFTTGQGVATSDNGIDWATIWPTSELGVLGNISLNDVTYGNGMYVIVGGTAGTTSLILTSSDGAAWTRRATTHTVGLTSIDYSPTLGMFLAAGQNGTTVYSTDGITWTSGVSAGAANITKVVWGGTQFALINTTNTSGQIYRSTNGTSFTAQSTTIGFTATDIAYSSTLNLWVITRSSANTSYVMTSPDLSSWTARTITGSTAGSAYGVVWNGSKFVVSTNGPGVVSSSDGTTWAIASNNLTQLGRMVAMPSGAVIAACYNDKGAAISYNSGVTWGTSITEVDTVVGQFRSNNTKLINAITYSGGRYWVSASNVSGQMYYSTDKKVWFTTQLPTGTAGTSYQALYVNATPAPYWVSPGTTGSAGRVLTSVNGDTWVTRTVPTQGTSWNEAATNGAITVMVNSGGQIASTTDGVTFTNRTSGTTAALRSVVYAGGKFVAVGASAAVYSTDGITWTNASTSFGTFNASKLIHDGTQFVAVGVGTATVNTKVSSNGITWATGPVAPWGTTGVSSLAHNGSVYVAKTGTIGQVVYVGSSLSTLAAVNLPIAIASATNGLVAVGTEFTLQSNYNSYQLTSIDNGATWSVWKTAEPVGAGQLATTFNNLLALDGSLALMLQYNGTNNVGFGKFDPSTKTFTKFTVNPAAGALAAYEVVKVGSTYIAGLGSGTNNGNISTSTDLSNWTTRFTIDATIRSIASNADGSVIIAATHYGSTAGSRGLYRTTSPTGAWTQPMSGAAPNFSKVIWANNLFVAVGHQGDPAGVILTSVDGSTWVYRVNAATEVFTSVAYGNGIYVATSSGTGNKFYSSSDGITWTPRGLTTFNAMYAIAYGAGRFWALGVNGTGYMSTDGINWTAATISFNHIAGLTWDGVDSFWAMNSRGSLYKYTPQ